MADQLAPYLVRQAEQRWAALVLTYDDGVADVVLFPAYFSDGLAKVKAVVASVGPDDDLPGLLRSKGYPVVGFAVAHIESLVGAGLEIAQVTGRGAMVAG